MHPSLSKDIEALEGVGQSIPKRISGFMGSTISKLSCKGYKKPHLANGFFNIYAFAGFKT